MIRKSIGGVSAIGMTLATILLSQASGDAQSCGVAGCSHHCPPAYRHTQEGPPNICITRGCPKPICSPCTNERWGYYETCWRRWPWPPNWSHCPVPPPGAYFDGTIPSPTDPGMLPLPKTQLPPSNGGQPKLPLQRLSMDFPPGR